MKNKSIVIAALGVFLLFNFNLELTAQKHYSKHKKVVVHKSKKSAKVYKFSRNKVVIVKQRRGRVIKTLPVGYRTFLFKKRNYYYHGGYYYSYFGDVYTLIAPPIGIRINIIPVGYKKIIMGGVTHYYYMGAYYKEIEHEYEVVEPVVGTVVSELPEDNVEEITIDGKKYYEYDNMLYKAIVVADGLQYEVVGKLDD
jgi:hypothetical protein